MKDEAKKPAARPKGDAAKDGGVVIDLLVEAGDWPAKASLSAISRRAVHGVLAEIGTAGRGSSEISLVFSDDAHIRTLNAGWRGKDKPTNVLSFPAFPDWRGGNLPPMLGDVILAAETVAAEAVAQGKPLADHISHLIVHGILHLIGYDHEADADAEEMETIERRVLAGMNVPDPY
jgi:probable rRNA maturation factor